MKRKEEERRGKEERRGAEGNIESFRSFRFFFLARAGERERKMDVAGEEKSAMACPCCQPGDLSGQNFAGIGRNQAPLYDEEILEEDSSSADEQITCLSLEVAQQQAQCEDLFR